MVPSGLNSLLKVCALNKIIVSLSPYPDHRLLGNLASQKAGAGAFVWRRTVAAAAVVVEQHLCLHLRDL